MKEIKTKSCENYSLHSMYCFRKQWEQRAPDTKRSKKMKEIKTKSCGRYDIYSMYCCLKQRGISVRWIKTGKSFMATAADGRKCRWTL